MTRASSRSSAPVLHVVEGDATTAVDRLVERALGGDRDAWARLYLDHFQGVLRLVAYATGDVAVSEELTQEAFAVALVQLPRFDGRCAFGGWMRGIAMKLVHKHWRKSRRRKRAYSRLSMADEDPSLAPDDRVLARRRAEALERALQDLPPNWREAFVLSDIHGMSAAQAAEEFGISPGNFRVRATRARARLRQRLTELGLVDRESGS